MQVPAVAGQPFPSIDTLFVSALLWCGPNTAADVLRHVHDDDLEAPTHSSILGAVRNLLAAGESASPQLVQAHLNRAGINRLVHATINDAFTAGACALAVREYAAGVVGQALRRRIESAGHALRSADDLSVDELPHVVATLNTAIADCYARLQRLGGEWP